MTLRAQVMSKRAIAYMQTKMLGQMQNVVAVRRPQGPSFNTTTGVYTANTTTTPVYSGKARIYPSSGGGNVPLGDGYLTMRTMIVSVMAAGSEVIQVNDLLVVTTAYDEPSLLNKWFRILDVDISGVLDPTRKLTCTEVEANSFHPQS